METKLKILLYIGFLSLSFTTNLLGQEEELILVEQEQNLRDGELHSVINVLTEIQKKSKLSRSNHARIHRILTEAYLFLPNKDSAEYHFQKLRKWHPFFQPQVGRDSPELFYLADNFPNRPFLSIGSKGINLVFSRASIRQSFNVNHIEDVKESYETDWVLQLPSLTIHYAPINSNLELGFDVAYEEYGYKYSSTYFFKQNDPSQREVGSHSFTEQHAWLNVPFYLKYNFLRSYKTSELLEEPNMDKSIWQRFKEGINLYIFVGGGPQILLEAQLKDIGVTWRDKDDNFGGATLSSFDLFGEKPLRRSLNYVALGGIGFEHQLNRFSFMVEGKYSYLITNPVKPEFRMKQPILNQELLYVDNDLRIQNFYFTAGILFDFYKPRKVKRLNDALGTIQK